MCSTTMGFCGCLGLLHSCFYSSNWVICSQEVGNRLSQPNYSDQLGSKIYIRNSCIPPWGVVVLHIGIGLRLAPICKTTPSFDCLQYAQTERGRSGTPPWGVVVLHIGIGLCLAPICKTTPSFDCLQYAQTERGRSGDFIMCNEVK